MDRVLDDPTVTELVDIWQEGLDTVAALSDPLDVTQWLASTPCPGWTVADVAAHLVDIEQLLAGDPRPQHEPEWSTLSHISDDFGRFTEVGVDARRGTPKTDVLDELRRVTAVRREQLEAVPPGADVTGPFGNTTTMERLLRIRIFDTWAHEQDIRAAIGQEGDWGTRPARISYQQTTRALPYVWSRTVAAPVGATVTVTITGPGLGDTFAVATEAEGIGAVVGPIADPTVGLTVSWPGFMRLACGRLDLDDPAERAGIVLNGDPALGELLLRGLAITP